MARKTIITVTDDLDGSEAADTVEFALEGVQYEIDLSDENAEKLREALGPWIAAARRVGGRQRRSTSTSGPSNAKLIRAWARENGHEVPDRGRISAEVREAYAAAH